MEAKYIPKHWLKLARWQARRGVVALRWGPAALARTPAVLGNAMPKSGSHLIIQVLEGLTTLGPFVNPGFRPVNRAEDNSKLPKDQILSAIRRMRPGDIGYGYIHATEPFVQALAAPGRATIFVYRDPRDAIVSSVFYATEIYKQHTMHPYYTRVLSSMEERINAEIGGVTEPGYELSPIRTKYDHYLGWLQVPEVLSLRFEDLILDQVASLGCILDYLETRGFTPRTSRQKAVAVLQQAIQPKKSGTFRKSKPGNWREHFSPANKAFFKEQTGDLLVRLGYEAGDTW